MQQRLPRKVLFGVAAAAIAAAGAIVSVPALAQPGPRGEEDRNLLDAEQINRIRQAELSENDFANPPRIRFDDRVINRFVEDSPTLEFRQFNERPDVVKALLILEQGTPEQRADVEILTDPVALRAFKQGIHEAVLQGCATSECHGSDDPQLHAGFRLHARGRGDDVVYTNFHTLVRTSVAVDNPAGGAFGGPSEVKRRMIERQNPDDSLLLSYGLPLRNTDTPHPVVEGFRPLWPTRQAPRYLLVRSWIGDVLKDGVTDYGIDRDMAEERQPQEQGR